VHFLLATWGSLGDLHPYLALGRGLQARGHRVTLCTGSIYREKVEREGLGWTPLRPELPAPENSAMLMGKLMDPRHGSRRVIREWIMPALSEMRTDLSAALKDGRVDVLIAHPILYAAPVAAKEANIPWVGTFLAPILLPSVYDPPVPPSHPSAGWVGALRPPLSTWALEAGKRRIRPWAAPADALRRSAGLPRAHPLFEGMHSPFLNLALFSRALGAPQPDWPKNTVQTGFAFYDRLEGGTDEALAPQTETFLAAGDAPLLFTLGSSAVMSPGRFFKLAIDATKALGARAILLTGKGVAPPENLPPGMLAVPYAPHSTIMPRCRAIVHQGGVGTTGQALRSGRPQIVVPFSHDQPDNAHRIARTGAGRVLPIGKLTEARLIQALQSLPDCAEKASALGKIVQAESGVETACDALESL
jgi:rhamnosyltransferase subunit B